MTTTSQPEASPSKEPTFEGKPTIVHLKDYTPPPFLADHVKLNINLNEVDTGKSDDEGKAIKHVLATVTNETTFRRNDNPDAIWEDELVLDGGTRNDANGNKVHCLNFKELWVNGKPHYDYTIDHESGKLIIKNLPDTMEPVTVKTIVETNASENKEYSGLYENKGLVSTQCESEGFRNMTYALDRPDVISTYDVTIEADKERFPLLLANPGADYVEPQDIGNGRHLARWNDPRPKPCYLFAMAALQGDVIRDTFTYPDGDTVELINVTDKGQGENARFSQACLKKAMQHEWDEWGHKYHGLHPDPNRPGKKKGTFITLAVSAFNMGAMENNGFNIFNDKLLLANPKNASDNRYFNIDSVVNHEYCHDETGNWRVPANWFQIAYKEGLTVRRDQTYTADMYDETFQRISDAQELRSGVFSLDDSPNTHPMVLPSYEGVSNNYDSLTYPKGAQVNQMLQAFVGKDAYRKAYREFHDNPHPEVCDVPSYLKFIGDHAHMSATFVGDKKYPLIDTFVDGWTTQSGVPTLKCDWVYDKERHVLKLEVEQILPKGATKPFVLPLKIGLVNPDTGKDYFLISPIGARYRTDGVLEIKDLKQTFEFSVFNEKGKDGEEAQEPAEPIVSINRDFTAYAKIDYADRVKPTFAQLAKQAEIDPNVFNRWDALQQIGIDVLKSQLTTGTADVSTLVAAYRSALSSPDITPLLKAELLRLPDTSTLSNLLPKGTINPIALRNARDAVRIAIASELKSEFKATYDAMQTSEAYRFDGSEMGRRALMNLSLAYLCADKSPESTALAKTQFDRFDNYNDIAASWGMLMDSGNAQAMGDAVQKIADVYQLTDKQAQDHLVLGDWLGRQAMAEGATPDDIKALLALPQIDKDNPNQIRSILGGAIGNLKLFHNPDGSGYRFIADQIMEVDAKNKETSSRIASGAFGAILKYTPAIQDRMAEAIGYIQTSMAGKLSPDCRGVLGKLMNSYEKAKAERSERNIVHEGTLGGASQGIQVA